VDENIGENIFRGEPSLRKSSKSPAKSKRLLELFSPSSRQPRSYEKTIPPSRKKHLESLLLMNEVAGHQLLAKLARALAV